jgi:hypothetical protein
MRRQALAFTLVVLVLLGSACTGTRNQDREALEAALFATSVLARQFTYTDESASTTTTVTGTVADDFRYSVSASVGGKGVASEIVVDESRALQVSDPGLLQQMVVTNVLPPAPITAASPSPTPAASPANSPAPVTPTTPAVAIPSALKAGQWVVDPAGASRLGQLNGVKYLTGQDPLYDSLTTLDYVRAAIGGAQSVVKFNPEDLNYRPKLDPFPRPPAGVTRYDVLIQHIQPIDPNAVSVSFLPGTTNFRLMAVYVKEGRVTSIREKIDVAAILADPSLHAGPRLQDYHIQFDTTASLPTQADQVLSQLNSVRTRAGQDPIRLRSMDTEFTSLGGAYAVALPNGAATGDLSGVGNHGQVLFEAAA